MNNFKIKKAVSRQKGNLSKKKQISGKLFLSNNIILFLQKTVKAFFFLVLWKKILLIIVLLALTLTVRFFLIRLQKDKISYETAVVEKGTLITSISAPGTISSGNYNNISTKASGIVSQVYVTNGDKVSKGQKIAEVTLDDYSLERQTTAWVDYLEAIEAQKDTEKAKVTADIAMWQDRQDLLDAQTTYKNMVAGAWNPTTNKEYTYNEKAIVTKQMEEAQKAFVSSETKYLNSDADIQSARASIASALRAYQENSSTIVAPASGVLSDLSLATGLVVNASSTTSSTSGATIISAQTVGKINHPESQLIASVTLTEVDVIMVKPNQKVTLTLDAYPEKSFTGKVLAVNTSGNVSSGVTSYPVTVLLDPVDVEIYPNMAVSVGIITNIKTDILVIPSTAIQDENGAFSVQIMRNGEPERKTIEIGIANDSQTEVVSGLSQGDVVVTSTITQSTTSQTDGNVTSPFSGIGRTQSSTRNSGGGLPAGGLPGF